MVTFDMRAKAKVDALNLKSLDMEYPLTELVQKSFKHLCLMIINYNAIDSHYHLGC